MDIVYRSISMQKVVLAEKDTTENTKKAWSYNILFTAVAYIGFELSMAVTMKSTVIWVVMPYSSERPQLFRGRCRFHFQDQRVSQGRNCLLLLVSCLPYSLTLNMGATSSSW
jgi:hypothetical protein